MCKVSNIANVATELSQNRKEQGLLMGTMHQISDGALSDCWVCFCREYDAVSVQAQFVTKLRYTQYLHKYQHVLLKCCFVGKCEQKCCKTWSSQVTKCDWIQTKEAVHSGQWGSIISASIFFHISISLCSQPSQIWKGTMWQRCPPECHWVQ